MYIYFYSFCCSNSWDFSYHPVSVFAYRLLDQIWKVPLFRVPDVSKDLYAKVRALRMGQMRRERLKFMNDFIKTCRFSDEYAFFFIDIVIKFIITNQIDNKIECKLFYYRSSQ